ncbi:NAD(P)-dependent glycerol-3-phosphate dehydrogenase [Bacteriovorax stolpii]|uniref:Glycerol-3-phosphate dehydrogenase [NAD(P)+] n=1 Tax=Bacteriovorax stolpii TaxID=960 RepID=A0A2K9NQR3_BACTC|nr:NAD(P)H-dependent glycerol-3-phosphate dehydrogenase [Bacteriovorax stolpii]AUN97848.1 glycerol-3-phosphate dehydrogenase [Bacteriovorax stolpii]QDK42166.1 NAD(P)-dependent glycerol-3-phosphate dehydrogenase [Bacteriovorax stolpii]TDP51676.1 glycerol 3-phosphate dehydrogenase (NAD(P)+) [Bacteriovorax stolpii]
MSTTKRQVALVIGAGAFGTAIAQVLAQNFEKVILKVRSKDIYDAIKAGENSIYLPGLKTASNIDAALSWDEVDAIGGKIELIVSALPSNGISEYFKENYDRFLGYFIKGIPLMSLSKGIDPDTLELSDDLFFDMYPHFKDQFCFLSGPSFAHEIMQDQITLVTLAGRSKQVLENVASMVNTSAFKVLASYDVKGVLLGGALKNILAIAGGVIEGLGYNHNTRAAMITRGIAEMLRFGAVYNARPETFYGLSGMGDLILTTTGDLSRNKTFGLELAKGRKAEEIIKSQRSVVEGYKTAKAAHFISERFDIRAQIFNGVYGVLYDGLEPREVITKLMRSPSKFES